MKFWSSIFKYEKVFVFLAVFITSIWLFGYVTTKKISTPYGVIIRTDTSTTINEVEYYTIEDDFIYFYDKRGAEPIFILAKGHVKVIETLKKPE